MRVALALGSGGARGYAHIGVLRELEARGHEVVGVSGASMGAVVGGLFAAGRLDDLEEWFRGMGQREVLRLLDVSFTGGGAIRANRIMTRIRELCDDVRIEDLPVGYTAVATDILARREVWFTRGPLDDALRASFAIPSIITPATVGGRHMVDGGVTNPVPMEPLATVDADMVMAVSLTGRREGMRGSAFRESSAPEETDGGSASAEPELSGGDGQKAGDRMRARTGQITQALNTNLGALGGRIRDAADSVGGNEYLRQLTNRLSQQLDTAPTGSSPTVAGVATDVEGETPVDVVPGPLPGTLGLFDVVVQSIDTMESIITAYRMAGNHPDVLVDVPADVCTAFDFHRAAEVIDVGRRLTAVQLDRIGL